MQVFKQMCFCPEKQTCCFSPWSFLQNKSETINVEGTIADISDTYPNRTIIFQTKINHTKFKKTIISESEKQLCFKCDGFILFLL